jgi:hypothetical protein
MHTYICDNCFFPVCARSLAPDLQDRVVCFFDISPQLIGSFYYDQGQPAVGTSHEKRPPREKLTRRERKKIAKVAQGLAGSDDAVPGTATDAVGHSVDTVGRDGERNDAGGNRGGDNDGGVDDRLDDERLDVDAGILTAEATGSDVSAEAVAAVAGTTTLSASPDATRTCIDTSKIAQLFHVHAVSSSAAPTSGGAAVIVAPDDESDPIARLKKRKAPMIDSRARRAIPIVHFTEVRLPFISCVTMDRGGAFEANLASLNVVDSVDYFLF